MKGNYRPTHNANNTNYNSTPADIDGANAAPFTVSYDQTGVNNPQAPQQSYSQVGNFAYNPSYSPSPTSFSPTPVDPQLSYTTSNASYSGSNTNMGSRVADVVRNINTDQIASNIESGISYATDKAGEFTATTKDKLSDPNRRKKMAIIGGAVASLALAMSLGNAVLNKANSSSYNQAPPAATSNNSSTEPQTSEAKDTDPNMNVETADSEHDGKISYKIYEYGYVNGYDTYTFVGDRTSQVDYSNDDNVDDRKEASMDDFIECISKQGDSSAKCSSIDEVFTKQEDYHGPNALVDLLQKYGGYNSGHITNLKKSDFINDYYEGLSIHNRCDYHFEDLATVNPAITDGRLKISIVNPNVDADKNKYDEYGYGGYFTISVDYLYINPDHKRLNGGGSEAGCDFVSGRIVCDHIPTEKELVQIIKDNYDSIFKVDNDRGGYNNRRSLEAIIKSRRKA